MKSFDVVNIGIIVIDIPVSIPYNLLDFKTDTIDVNAFQMLLGGDAANSSVVLTQLGKKVALAGVVGADGLGRLALEMLERRGVYLRGVVTKPEVATSVSVVMINQKGERTFVCSKGNNLTLGEEDFDYTLLQAARHVNLSSLFAHPRLDGGGAATIFRKAKEMGLTTSADVTNDSLHIGFEKIKGFLEFVDIFMPSYIEAKYLTAETDPERMARFLVNQTGEKTVIIKLGGDGCYIYEKQKGITLPAFKVEVRDTTGAGDTFVAGVISAFLDGNSMRDCAIFASAASAINVQYIGASPEHVTKQNVKDFLTGQISNEANLIS